jgi:phosphoketolase
MIPSHILDGLRPDDRVAILARGGPQGGELHFLVHAASDGPDVIRAHAVRDGSEVLATHLSDKEAILEFVAARERDVGGEG